MSKSDGGHDFERRENSLEEVRKRLRSGWRHDPHILDQYFKSCYNNWKVYTGPRTPKQVLKLQSIYKQAVYGDNNELPPEDLTTVEGEKWRAWAKLRGTPKEMAKRRFITFLAEIDPLLIDVMPDEKPPIGFPLDRRGNPICAKCNTVVGCIRPIVDQHKMPLKQVLFENEEFHEPEKLKEWVRSALLNQRCVWGIHMPITRAEARPFMDWFNRDENRGFYPYDSAPIMAMVREVVTNYHQMAQEMMESVEKVDPELYNAVAIKCYKLKEVYESFSGEDYKFEVPCTRDNESCNQRRIADGGKNHHHEFIIDPPTKTDVSIMEEAIMLRKQCQRLGINPSTGVVKSLQERCDIYRQRIAEHFAALKRATEAKARNDNRAVVHKTEKETVIALSKEMLQRQMWDACQENLIDNIMVLAKRGSNVNEESPRGLTPLICMVVNEAVVEKIEVLINTYSADINQSNKFGMTPLMMACRMKDMKMVHVLMRNGASALQKGYNGQTALHVCAIQGSEEIARTIVDYLKDGVGDSMRVTRFLDAMDDNGDTALIVAARRRNGILCYTLCSLGCNPGIRNSTGRTAAYVARSKTWNEISEWLEKKVGTGANRIETFSDLEFEKKCRFGLIKTRELLQNFARTYLMLVQNRLGLHPLGTPYKAKSLIDDRGERARKEQRKFMDFHFRYLLKRYPEQYPSLLASLPASYHNEHHQDHILTDTEVEERLDELRTTLAEIMKLIRQGYTYPNTDIAAQPIAWTPMMCAVVLNDSRSIKILYREGGDPNFANKDGTTPVMLAAQLHHNQALIDLLSIGGDLQATDNMGYPALAYATSLPLPTIMDRTYMDKMTNDDVGGPKLLSSEEVIKAALIELPTPDPATAHQKDKDQDRPTGKIGGPSGGALQTATEKLKELLTKNDAEASPENVETQSKFLQLLHQYGLTPIREEANIDRQLKSTKWRMIDRPNRDNDDDNDGDGESKRSSKRKKTDNNDDDEDGEFAEDLFGDEARRKYEEEQARIRQEKEEHLKKMDPNVLRCPICTLVPPCPHFFKIDSLLSFIKKNESVQVHGHGSNGPVIRMARKVKMKNRATEVLEETEIHDRGTDRSATLAKKYQAREEALEKARAERHAAQRAVDAQAALEAADYEAFERDARASGVLKDDTVVEELFEVPSSAGMSPRDGGSSGTNSSGASSASVSPSASPSLPSSTDEDDASLSRSDTPMSQASTSSGGLGEEMSDTGSERSIEDDVYDRLPGSAGGLPLVREGEFTPEMSLAIIPVPILKSREGSRHSRRARVRFNLPEGEDEDDGGGGDDPNDGDGEGDDENSSGMDSGRENSDGSDSDSGGSGLVSPAAGTDDSNSGGRPPLVPRRKKRKVPRRKPSKAVEWRIADDKAAKHFQTHPDFAGWPSENDDEDTTSVNGNANGLHGHDHSHETAIDTSAAEESAVVATTHDLVVQTATESTDDDQADEDDYNSWCEEQEQKAHEGVEGELRMAFDILTTGKVAKGYKDALHAREQRELDAQHAHVRVFPFHKGDAMGFTDGVFTSMSETLPLPAASTSASSSTANASKPLPPAIDAAQRKITLPGYLFFHLSDLRSPTLPPISMSLTQVAWVKVLENINDHFHQTWRHQQDLSVLIHHTTWTVLAPPCVLCEIGYIRHKETLQLYREDRGRYEEERAKLLKKLFEPSPPSTSSQDSLPSISPSPSPAPATTSHSFFPDDDNETSESATSTRPATAASSDDPASSQPATPHTSSHHSGTTHEDEAALLPYLCFSCLVRRELYHQVLKTQPRAVRRTLHTRWPLLATHDPHFNHMPQMEHVDAIMNPFAIAPLPKEFPLLGLPMVSAASTHGTPSSPMATPVRQPMVVPGASAPSTSLSWSTPSSPLHSPSKGDPLLRSSSSVPALAPPQQPSKRKDSSSSASSASSASSTSSASSFLPHQGGRDEMTSTHHQAGFFASLLAGSSSSQSDDSRDDGGSGDAGDNNRGGGGSGAVVPDALQVMDHVDALLPDTATTSDRIVSLSELAGNPHALTLTIPTSPTSRNGLPPSTATSSSSATSLLALHSSPIKSDKLRALDDLLEQHMRQRLLEWNTAEASAGSHSSGHSDGDGDGDVDDDVSQVSSLSQVSITHEKTWMVQALAALDSSASVKEKLLLAAHDKLHGDGTGGASDASQSSLGTAVTVSTVSQVNPYKRPRELTLLPYYIAQGLFEDSERLVRILLGKPAVDEGEGHAFLLELLMQTAEAYKLTGLYVLSLSVYVDALTRTAALCGWMDRLTYEVCLPSLLLCYRRMGLDNDAETLMKSMFQELQVSMRTKGKQEVIKKLHHMHRQTVVRFIKINSLWTKYLQPRLFAPIDEEAAGAAAAAATTATASVATPTSETKTAEGSGSTHNQSHPRTSSVPTAGSSTAASSNVTKTNANQHSNKSQPSGSGSTDHHTNKHQPSEGHPSPNGDGSIDARFIDDTKVPTSRFHSTSHLKDAKQQEQQSIHQAAAMAHQPLRKWHRFERLVGLVGLYVFYTSTLPVFVTQRKVFREYCRDLQRQYMANQATIARYRRQRERLTMQHREQQQVAESALTSSTPHVPVGKRIADAMTIDEIDATLAKLAREGPQDRKYITPETYQYLDVLVSFLDVYFTIYQVEDPVVYRYLLQHLWRHYLAKSVAQQSPLPRWFRELTPRAHIMEIAFFFRFGKELSLSVFDPLVMHLMERVLPCYRRFFLHAPAGDSYRELFLVTVGHMDDDAEGQLSPTPREGDEDDSFAIPAVAEAIDQAAMIIQTLARAYLTRQHHVFGPALRRRLKEEVAREAQRKAAEAAAKAAAEQAARDEEARAAKKKRNARLSVMLPSAPTLPKRQHY